MSGRRDTADGPRRLILNVDTGTDDALAIMLALAHPALHLEALLAVHGNAPLEVVLDNTLRVVDLMGAGVPVFRGLEGPLARSRECIEVPGRAVHSQPLPLPPARSRPAADGAVEHLIDAVMASDGDLTLVSTAPLSTVARAFEREPRVAGRLRELLVLGGTHAVGNVTPSAEFNVWADPEAARAVLRAHTRRTTLVTLDTTHRAPVGRDACRRLRASGGAVAMAAADLIEARIDAYRDRPAMAARDAAPIHDAFAVACLIDPRLIVTTPVHVDVETDGELTTGRTVLDLDRRGGQVANVAYASPGRPERFAVLLERTLAGACR